MTSCKNPEIKQLIAAYELGMLTEEQEAAFERHIMECDACFGALAEMDLLMSRIREQRMAPDEDPAILPPGSKAAEGAHGSPEKSQPGTARRFWRPWSFALAGAAATLVILFMIQKPFLPTQDDKARGIDGNAIIVYAREGEVSSLKKFEWRMVPDATSYKVIVFDSNGNTLWSGCTGPQRFDSCHL